MISVMAVRQVKYSSGILAKEFEALGFSVEGFGLQVESTYSGCNSREMGDY